MEAENDPAVILKDAGFEIGDNVKERGVADGAIYVVVTVGSPVVLCKSDAHASDETVEKVKVPLDTFLKTGPSMKETCPQSSKRHRVPWS